MENRVYVREYIEELPKQQKVQEPKKTVIILEISPKPKNDLNYVE